MIRTHDHKLIYRPGGVSELYDLTTAPEQLHNLYGHSQCSAVQHELECRLLDWYVHTNDVVPRIRQSRGYSEEVRRKLAVPSGSDDASRPA